MGENMRWLEDASWYQFEWQYDLGQALNRIPLIGEILARLVCPRCIF